jgi:hypothetical protein
MNFNFLQIKKEGDIYATGKNAQGSFTWTGQLVDNVYEIE